MEVEVIPDTTVQEKNITFPTDTKLHLKIIDYCRKLSQQNNLKLRQSYVRKLKKLRFLSRYLKVPTRAKEGRRAIAKIKTIAGRLFRELIRKLSKEAKQQNAKLLEIMERVLTQKRDSKNKIYSIHEPGVSCIAKGKDHIKYEFGSKVSIIVTKNSGIIVGALSFKGNPYDGNTHEPSLAQAERLRGIAAKKSLVDEGYRGRSKIGETEVVRAHQQKMLSKYSKYQCRQWFRRRASVEAAISHLKNDYRLSRNYLKGDAGDQINVLLSAAAFNFKKLMIKLAFIFRFFRFDFFQNILNLNFFIICQFIFIF
jgi:IS5 family transposase